MFDRLKLIMDNKVLNKIQNLNVLIVGIGGVGGNALESLVRFGVKNITIIDKDVIDITNLNRQLITTNNNIGNSKVEEAIKRAELINPDINITGINEFLDKNNIANIISNKYDYVIDACDTVTTKLDIMKICQKLNIDFITCLGTGNRFDPTKLAITKLSKTTGDPLAKVLRKLVKDNKLKDNINVVWSSELPIKTGGRTPGSNSLVPNVAGIYCASYIINNEIKKSNSN